MGVFSDDSRLIQISVTSCGKVHFIRVNTVHVTNMLRYEPLFSVPV